MLKFRRFMGTMFLNYLFLFLLGRNIFINTQYSTHSQPTLVQQPGLRARCSRRRARHSPLPPAPSAWPRICPSPSGWFAPPVVPPAHRCTSWSSRKWSVVPPKRIIVFLHKYILCMSILRGERYLKEKRVLLSFNCFNFRCYFKIGKDEDPV